MQKRRFFLKGSAAEVAWLNRQAAWGYQLTAIHGLSYQFKEVPQARQLIAEYMPQTTLQAMTTVFQPLTSYTFHDDMAVVYSTVAPKQRVVNNDQQYRLAVYRHARDVALNWLNGWVLVVWLMMSATIVISSQLQATPLLTRLLLLGLALGAGVMVAGIIVGVRTAIRCHREVCRLIRITGDNHETWKPTFHVLFKHQHAAPDTTCWDDLGSWQLALHNQRGDYYFELKTTLSELEITNTLAQRFSKQDFSVVSWLGLYVV